jgi:hypothetical protein
MTPKEQLIERLIATLPPREALIRRLVINTNERRQVLMLSGHCTPGGSPEDEDYPEDHKYWEGLRNELEDERLALLAECKALIGTDDVEKL